MKIMENKVLEDFAELGLEWIELSFLTKNHNASKTWLSLGYETFRETCRKKIIRIKES